MENHLILIGGFSFGKNWMRFCFVWVPKLFLLYLGMRIRMVFGGVWRAGRLVFVKIGRGIRLEVSNRTRTYPTLSYSTIVNISCIPQQPYHLSTNIPPNPPTPPTNTNPTSNKPSHLLSLHTRTTHTPQPRPHPTSETGSTHPPIHRHHQHPPSAHQPRNSKQARPRAKQSRGRGAGRSGGRGVVWCRDNGTAEQNAVASATGAGHWARAGFVGVMGVVAAAQVFFFLHAFAPRCLRREAESASVLQAELSYSR
ncbi:uncharacterized protein K452DRAFT_128486 [Aplosporella prunicola CBS 121167]|uniref:Uncharacterized protein n=1 Tax=Aplosporella prunicola CBS 121167 TaxID=1176127 RepID=A0A6A6B1G0_9PEZI|nr:uncharacterized protein K452DRAFT_128486 [Aplosporella prunicola CBS 121167]KAF2136571.1 hypothetical protein K452DRAFT_128486 [Aplosporella prunicola CBS 121167]